MTDMRKTGGRTFLSAIAKQCHPHGMTDMNVCLPNDEAGRNAGPPCGPHEELFQISSAV